jgi:transcriptional regulator with XRE-family HTH domain
MKTRIDTMIGKRIKELRKKAGFTQAEMAEKLNISVSGYSKLEGGYRGLSIENCLVISKELGVSCDYIIMGVEHQIKQDISSVVENLRAAAKVANFLADSLSEQ